MLKVFFLIASLVPLCSGQWFAGGTAGIATLSGDGATNIDRDQTAISLYQPKNGPAFQIFAGKHIREYFSLQAAYGFNRNNVTFTGLATANNREDSFEQARTATQQSFGLDAMIHVLPRTNRFRPYVSGGAGTIHLASSSKSVRIQKGNPTLPPNEFSNSKLYWRTAVGLDLRLRPGWQFRYTFWETVSANPLSAQLRPRGKALFLNFLNQFGIVREF
ncbi:MAG: porin family protein [Acidobacteria bacterium]|nr:porin family protein [Acidobacteriota bacterium]